MSFTCFFQKIDKTLFRWAYILIFLIPLNIFIIGPGIGVGIQWAFFRYQETGLGNSMITIIRSVDYAVSGIITGKTAFSEMFLFIGVLFFVISFILIQLSVNGNLKFPGLLTIIGALFVLIADVIQVGLLFSGPGGTYIPVGIPLVIIVGYLMYKTDSGEPENLSTVPDTGEPDIKKHYDLEDLKTPQIRAGESTPWKVLFILLCLFVIIMNLELIVPLIENPKFGWDFNIYMSSVEALSDGKDPYTISLLPVNTPGITTHYAYPPFTLPLFGFISHLYHFFQTSVFYYVILIIMLLTTAIILIKTNDNTDYLLLTALLISAFAGNYWIFQSGNIALIYVVFSALLFFLIIKEHFVLSTIVMGIFAAFSLFPVLFNGIYIALNDSYRQRLVYILYSLGISAAILLLSFCANPTLFLSFIRASFGTTSSLHEYGGRDTPTPILFIADLIESINIHSSEITGLAILIFIGIIIAATALYIQKNRGNSVYCYSFIFMALFLLMPRIKSYYFPILVVPIYFLLMDTSSRTKCIATIIVSLFPLLCLFNNWYLVKMLPDLINQYSQTVSLLCFMVFIFLKSDEKMPDKKI